MSKSCKPTTSERTTVTRIILERAQPLQPEEHQQPVGKKQGMLIRQRLQQQMTANKGCLHVEMFFMSAYYSPKGSH